jgi:hypothetical protein
MSAASFDAQLSNTAAANFATKLSISALLLLLLIIQWKLLYLCEIEINCKTLA